MIGKSALDKARAGVEQARANLERWQAQRAAQLAELGDLEARVGDDVLAAGDDAERAAGLLAGQVAALRAAVDVSGRTAVAAAERRLDQAERAALAAEADDLDDRAATLDQDADARETRTRDLLRQLREHEGVDFTAALASADGVARQPIAPRTQTAALRAEAAVLRQQALVLRHTAIGGAVPDFVPGETGVPAAPLLTDSVRAYRDKRFATV